MKTLHPIITIVMIFALGFSTVAHAEKGQWKKGRIYYRMVCTECHAAEAGRKISPADKTKAEWAEYFRVDQHYADDSHPVSYYVSKAFRESIKDQNRAAKKMLKVPDSQLLEDVKAFVDHTAKDSDQPSTCQ